MLGSDSHWAFPQPGDLLRNTPEMRARGLRWFRIKRYSSYDAYLQPTNLELTLYWASEEQPCCGTVYTPACSRRGKARPVIPMVNDLRTCCCEAATVDPSSAKSTSCSVKRSSNSQQFAVYLSWFCCAQHADSISKLAFSLPAHCTLGPCPLHNAPLLFFPCVAWSGKQIQGTHTATVAGRPPKRYQEKSSGANTSKVACHVESCSPTVGALAEQLHVLTLQRRAFPWLRLLHSIPRGQPPRLWRWHSVWSPIQLRAHSQRIDGPGKVSRMCCVCSCACAVPEAPGPAARRRWLEITEWLCGGAAMRALPQTPSWWRTISSSLPPVSSCEWSRTPSGAPPTGPPASARIQDDGIPAAVMQGAAVLPAEPCRPWSAAAARFPRLMQLPEQWRATPLRVSLP